MDLVKGAAVLQSVCKMITLPRPWNNHNILWFILPPTTIYSDKGRTNRDLTYPVYVIYLDHKEQHTTAKRSEDHQTRREPLRSLSLGLSH